MKTFYLYYCSFSPPPQKKKTKKKKKQTNKQTNQKTPKNNKKTNKQKTKKKHQKPTNQPTNKNKNIKNNNKIPTTKQTTSQPTKQSKNVDTIFTQSNCALFQIMLALIWNYGISLKIILTAFTIVENSGGQRTHDNLGR